MENKVEITWGGEPATVKQAPLTFGEANDATEKCTDMKTRIVNFVKLYELKVLKSIKEAPFDVTLENIRKLSEEDGNKLLNNLMEMEKLSKNEEGEVQIATFPDGSAEGPKNK